MREIKFRIWVLPNEGFGGEMETESFGMCPKGSWWQYADQGYYINNKGEPKEFELMQFTGSKDKNGVEIYEGDIIDMVTPNIFKKFKTRTYQIKWDRFKWVAVALDGQFKQVFPKNFTETERVKSKIIGNIYEKPELIKD